MENNLELVVHPNEILHRVSVACDIFSDPPVHLACKMLDWVLAYNSIPQKMRAVGLAAPQVGFNLRIFVMVPHAKVGGGFSSSICINPKIVRHGRGERTEYEGCLSLPDQMHRISRWEVIDVEYFDEYHCPVKKTLKYWEARIFQHEMDHLEGRLCIRA